MTDEQNEWRIHGRRSRDTRLMLVGEEREADFAPGHDVHKYSADTSAQVAIHFFLRSTSQKEASSSSREKKKNGTERHSLREIHLQLLNKSFL